VDRLSVFKALGDNTRYAVYAQVAAADERVATAEIADQLGLHPNTVRAHLERLREVGLVEMSADAHGTVGRPQHCWSVSAAGPSLGLEPSGFRLLAHLLAEAVAGAGVADRDLRAVGRQGGNSAGAGRAVGDPGRGGGLRAVVDGEARLGFDPVVTDDGVDGRRAGRESTVAFVRCPFRELAAAFPDVICELHRGLTEGMAADARMRVCAFDTLVDENPCRVQLTAAP
jgi:predicted ArsR family transcriptional regulator